MGSERTDSGTGVPESMEVQERGYNSATGREGRAARAVTAGTEAPAIGAAAREAVVASERLFTVARV